MNTNCGISRWDSPKDINAQLRALTSEPIWEVSDEYYTGTVLPSRVTASMSSPS